MPSFGWLTPRPPKISHVTLVEVVEPICVGTSRLGARVMPLLEPPIFLGIQMVCSVGETDLGDEGPHACE